MSNDVVGTLGVADKLTVGGRDIYDLTNLIRLVCYTGTANTNGTFRLQNGSAGYQVTALKTLTIVALRLQTYSAAINPLGFQLVQTDNDVGFASGTAFTNPVYEGRDSGLFPYTINVGSATNITYFNDFPTNFTVAAGKYLSCVPNSGGALITQVAWGYES